MILAKCVGAKTYFSHFSIINVQDTSYSFIIRTHYSCVRELAHENKFLILKFQEILNIYTKYVILDHPFFFTFIYILLLQQNNFCLLYFSVNLYELKTYHEVIDEIYYKVAHLEPWEKGSRKTAGQTGMCGGVGINSSQ